MVWTANPGCGSCNRCELSRRTANIVLDDCSLKPGSQVELTLSNGQIALSLFFAFMLPAIFAILAIVLTANFGGNDTIGAMAALGAIALGWGLMALIVRHHPQWFRLQANRGEHHA